MARWKPPAFRTTEEYSKWAYMYVKRLAKVVPSLSIATTVIRFLQLALMAALSLAYATGSPGVYHDVLVWDKNVSAPFEVTVYRNLTSWTVVHDQNLSQSENTIVGSFVWTGDSAPGCGKYSCNDTRYNCSGDKWQSSRIGYGDSPGFGKKGDYPNRTYGIDRAVFGLIVVIVSLSAGQTLWVIAHHLEPSGVSIYRALYIAHFIIDIFLIINFEKLAPIARLPGGELHQLHQQAGEFGPQVVVVTSTSRSEWTGSVQSSSTAVRRVSGGFFSPELV
ncbi:hypothetical protein C7212DRAFT_365448 [Tuber magnatum]|uniref:Uncharacterized protein n=1 Tax=Tuber magnatum TaxID=42249 RepID=A0A317SHI4_9PEZI|nr:hypothetical protein C7212DRAFT_365448 [Tuber magnatum]